MPQCSSIINRFLQLKGYNGRYNDVLSVAMEEENFKMDKTRESPGHRGNSVVIYFGGDIQDFTKNMREQRFANYSLENTALSLYKKFRQAHVMIVRPSRYYEGAYSCYDNFVPSDQYGAPLFTEYNNALVHLKMLLDSTGTAEYLLQKSGKSISSNLDKCDVKLIGFSKGCVVLNEIVQELHSIRWEKQKDNIAIGMLSRITDMYFLDSGHSGEKNAWITDRHLLETLASSDIKLHVHVTPYQVNCIRRPWIGKEERLFSETLKELNANITRRLHFGDEPPSLMNHLKILDVFS